LARDVKSRFMRAFEANAAEIHAAFHGTNAANYRSIYQRGLLIPGQGNELKIVHGAVHGTGIYTANVDAAWLSRSFCTEESMLVCAVIHTCEVRHHGDAMIVPRVDLVAPIFLATRGADAYDFSQRRWSAAGNAVAQNAPKNSKGVKAESKSSKFKAKLAAKSQRR